MPSIVPQQFENSPLGILKRTWGKEMQLWPSEKATVTSVAGSTVTSLYEIPGQLSSERLEHLRSIYNVAYAKPILRYLPLKLAGLVTPHGMMAGSEIGKVAPVALSNETMTICWIDHIFCLGEKEDSSRFPCYIINSDDDHVSLAEIRAFLLAASIAEKSFSDERKTDLESEEDDLEIDYGQANALLLARPIQQVVLERVPDLGISYSDLFNTKYDVEPED